MSGHMLKGDGPQKAGAGQILVKESVPSGSGYGRVQRVRNVGASPLELAKHRGKLSAREHAAGALFARLYALKARSGKDSTDMESRVNGASAEPWTQTQVNAVHDLEAIARKVSAADFRIVEHFAGEGCSIA